MRSLPSILHVDLDAFYASVEQLHKPSLRGKPVVVGGIGTRGVVSTASYEARAFGVHSALATGIARRRAPNAAYLIPRFGAYQAYSERVMALMHELSPLVEPLSLDEAFIDISHLFEPLDSQSTQNATLKARHIADELRERIKAETGLTASIGAGTSKLIAKIASDADKPDGLVVIEPGHEQAWLDPLPVRALWGVGPATAERLRKIGATTVAELRTLSHAELTTVVGASYGATLYEIARGQDDRDVSTDRELKSVSVEDTFAEDLLDPATITAHMDDLVTRLSSRIRKAGRSGRTITIKVRGHDFTTVSRSETTPNPTDDPTAIRAATHRMLPGAVAAATQTTPGIRLLGVGLTGLAEWAQVDLFSAEEDLDTLDFWNRKAEAERDDDFDMPRGIIEKPATGDPVTAGLDSAEIPATPGAEVATTGPAATQAEAGGRAEAGAEVDGIGIGNQAEVGGGKHGAPDVPATADHTAGGEVDSAAGGEAAGAAGIRAGAGGEVDGAAGGSLNGGAGGQAEAGGAAAGAAGIRADAGGEVDGAAGGGVNGAAGGGAGGVAGIRAGAGVEVDSAAGGSVNGAAGGGAGGVAGIRAGAGGQAEAAGAAAGAAGGEAAVEPEPDPADITTPVATVEGERSPRQFGPLPPGARGAVEAAVSERRFLPGQDVAHDEFGSGWVQGSGLGRVTVRFESPWSGAGRIKTLWAVDPGLHFVDAAAVAREALALRAEPDVPTTGAGPGDSPGRSEARAS